MYFIFQIWFCQFKNSLKNYDIWTNVSIKKATTKESKLIKNISHHYTFLFLAFTVVELLFFYFFLPGLYFYKQNNQNKHVGHSGKMVSICPYLINKRNECKAIRNKKKGNVSGWDWSLTNMILSCDSCCILFLFCFVLFFSEKYLSNLFTVLIFN